MRNFLEFIGDELLISRTVKRSCRRAEISGDSSGWKLHLLHLLGCEGHRIFEIFATAIRNDSREPKPIECFFISWLHIFGHIAISD